MNVITFRAEGRDDAIYACGKCGCVFNDLSTAWRGGESTGLASAEECCRPRICECGAECAPHRTACSLCLARKDRERTEARVQRATQYTVDTVPDGPLYVEDDHFFHDVPELLEWMDGEDLEGPVVAWLCDVETPQLDPSDVFESFELRLELGSDVTLEDVVTDLEDLERAIKAWNAKQTPSLWSPRDDACLIVRR